MRRRLPRGVAPYLIGFAAITVALSGTAVAATAKQVVLGHHNTAKKVTTLKDSHGTPLVLIGRKTKSPLSVSNGVVVPSLNASTLAGVTASQLPPRDLLFTAPGQTSFTVPKGVHHMIALVVGGGGGGAGGNGGGGGGGGQGATAAAWTPVSPGSPWAVFVGAGGARGSGLLAGGTSGDPTEVEPLGNDDGHSLVVGATGGAGGLPGSATCPFIAGASAGGLPEAPGSELVAVGAKPLEGVSGEPGGASSWSGPCPASASGGSGGGAELGTAGAGGQGEGVAQTSSDGDSGLVMIEFLR